MEFHPIANIFPLLQGKAFDELCEDIKANGLLEPIWLYEDKILDGRNRYRGCDAIGYELKATDFRTYEGSDPYGFVGSLNIQRRHLNKSQRAMAVADLVTAKGGGDWRKGARDDEVTAKQAGATVGISAQSVLFARAVKKRGVPELVSLVEQGRLEVSRARNVSKLRPEQQRAILQQVSVPAGIDRPIADAALEAAVRAVAPEAQRLVAPCFVKDLHEMAVRLLEYFTAPQIDLLWDLIAKKQAEMIAARKDKR